MMQRYGVENVNNHFVIFNTICDTTQISRANSLQHLNIGGTFITDTSLFAITGSCPNLKMAETGKIPGRGQLYLANHRNEMDHMFMRQLKRCPSDASSGPVSPMDVRLYGGSNHNGN